MKIEATGKTVDVAIENALKKSGLTIDQVETEVVSQGGFLKQCKVVVTKKLTEGEQAKQFLENVLEKMGFIKTVVEMTEDKDNVYINLVGTESGVIGYRGEVLDALQYLTSLVLNSKKSFKRIVLDCEGYREKREKTLIQLAKNLEQMEALGAYEVAPEDFALCEFVCTSKMELQSIVREALDYMRKELE